MDIYRNMGIVTKTGDKGQTKMISQVKGQHRMVDKDSQITWAIGTIDELNSFLGVVKTAYSDPEMIEDIQTNLFTISSLLAGGKVDFDNSETVEMENDIAHVESVLPEITNFVYSGGTELVAAFHYARAIARRAEREVVALSKVDKVNPDVLVYMNRLSDYLFILMRLETHKNHLAEKVWKPIRKLTPLPETVQVGEVEGYKQEDLMKWLNDNEVEADEFFKTGIRVAINKGEVVVLRQDADELISKLK